MCSAHRPISLNTFIFKKTICFITTYKIYKIYLTSSFISEVLCTFIMHICLLIQQNGIKLLLLPWETKLRKIGFDFCPVFYFKKKQNIFCYGFFFGKSDSQQFTSLHFPVLSDKVWIINPPRVWFGQLPILFCDLNLSCFRNIGEIIKI